MKRLIATLLLSGTLLAGCGSAKPAPTPPSAPAPSTAPAKSAAMVSVTASDLLKRVQTGGQPLIIDVRERSEFDEGHIAGARLMPLGTVEKAIAAAGIAKEQEIYLICRSGNRSSQAYAKLSALGYSNLKNVTGGMNEWAKVGPVTR